MYVLSPFCPLLTVTLSVTYRYTPEGIASNACVNGNVHLFNVNESESLGPYMARYMGAKFYR
jgi:hypothetical protein